MTLEAGAEAAPPQAPLPHPGASPPVIGSPPSRLLILTLSPVVRAEHFSLDI